MVSSIDAFDGQGFDIEIVKHPEIDRDTAFFGIEARFCGFPVPFGKARIIGIVREGRAAAGGAEIVPVLGCGRGILRRVADRSGQVELVGLAIGP